MAEPISKDINALKRISAKKRLPNHKERNIKLKTDTDMKIWTRLKERANLNPSSSINGPKSTTKKLVKTSPLFLISYASDIIASVRKLRSIFMILRRSRNVRMINTNLKNVFT